MLASEPATMGLSNRADLKVRPYLLWNPEDGTIDQDIPKQTSPLRLEKFSEQVEEIYVARYKGLPPHTAVK
ncbi:hypothetical protein CEE36_07605 [candidate division TA06 bacterium B3_TA06]|uniref:Uncharacterized protein n=1 Tax=candidate division TA06 bacterium B3_TA06 TaxID=2012487 RepID=A0A532V4F2_UNCT6|nr:MAG: hypothetical protein CEE36_07605 [candidate division TA06 bacterium B3_TA06]